MKEIQTSPIFTDPEYIFHIGNTHKCNEITET